MKADSVNRWLTLGANIGVVIGLVLLIVELDQNRDMIRAKIHQDRSDAWVAYTFERADSEFMLPVMEKLYAAGFPDNLGAMDGLTPVESLRVKILLHAFAGDYDNLFYQYQQGYVHDEIYKSSIKDSIRTLAPWWKIVEVSRRPSFHKEIERIMAGD